MSTESKPESTIEALRNPRTNKLFIVLEYGPIPGKVKVINPGGDVLDVADVIFDMDNPELIIQDKWSVEFSPEQLSAHDRYQNESKVEVQNKQRVAKPVTARRETKSDSAPKKSGRLVEWTSDVLIFYRHKIDPMRERDEFAIHVQGKGTLRMTKGQFLRVFNNVIMSSQYRQQGSYTFSEIPEQAKEFFT